jgi:hypothetical protein
LRRLPSKRRTPALQCKHAIRVIPTIFETDQERAQGWGRVIEASDDSEAQNRQTSDSVGVDSQGPTTELIGGCSRKEN